MEEQPKSWLILRCRIGSERTETKRLNDAGIAAKHPRIIRVFKREHRLGSQRQAKTVRQGWALIAGFVFVRAPDALEDDIRLIRKCAEGPKAKIRGYVARNAMRHPEYPYRLPDAEMRRMIEQAKAIGKAKSQEALQPGDWATVALGSLAGMNLRLVRFLDDDRTAVVEVNILGRSGEASVPRSELLPVED